MLVKIFQNNGRNSKNIVKLNLGRNINFCGIIILPTCVQRKQLVYNFIIILPRKSVTSLCYSSELSVIIQSVWKIVPLIYIW